MQRIVSRRIPRFKNEDQEREFWASHSPLDYFDSSTMKKGSFPNLKPSMKSISIRMPSDMLAELKTLANKKDVPYQSLAKVYLARQIALERGTLRRSPKPKRKGKPRAHLEERASRGSRRKFTKAMAKAPHRPPLLGDELQPRS